MSRLETGCASWSNETLASFVEEVREEIKIKIWPEERTML